MRSDKNLHSAASRCTDNSVFRRRVRLPGLLLLSVVAIANSAAAPPPAQYRAELERPDPGLAIIVPEIEWRDDCHRVLNDPSVVNRYAFNSFHQYLEYCVEKKSKGEQLPWAREVLALDVRRIPERPAIS